MILLEWNEKQTQRKIKSFIILIGIVRLNRQIILHFYRFNKTFSSIHSWNSNARKNNTFGIQTRRERMVQQKEIETNLCVIYNVNSAQSGSLTIFLSLLYILLAIVSFFSIRTKHSKLFHHTLPRPQPLYSTEWIWK